MHKIHPVILCGGNGTRLWPLSTPARPKQFLSLTNSRCMLEETAARFRFSSDNNLSFTETCIVGSRNHEQLIHTILPNALKILEPFGRNSAPAIAAACLTFDENDLVIVLPADHFIHDVPAFHQAISSATSAANRGAIITFGIEPTRPASEYGYIKARRVPGARVLNVESFVEKPNYRTAKSYLAEGGYFWNAGIFLFKVRTMLTALAELAPDVLAGTIRAMPAATNTPTINLEQAAFADVPNISIDHAVMERASNVKTVPVSMGWSDVGGYRALHDLLTNTADDNYVSGPVTIQNSRGLYVRSDGPAISVNGVSDLVIVAHQNEVMVTPIQDDAAIKSFGHLAQSKRNYPGVSEQMRQRAKSWISAALDVWAELGWDDERSGFVEQLNGHGMPDLIANRRVRVQARQVYSFSKAIDMHWSKPALAKHLVERGIAHIDKNLRHPDGGFVHITHPDGSVVDDRRDCYDHAFIILGASAAFKATGNHIARKVAEDALTYINQHLKDNEFGGWFESSNFELPRRSNPHMHLLEAMLEYHEATGSDAALEHAAEIVELFETRFFNPATDIMAELFRSDWSLEHGKDQAIWEPGHHFEWASLLNKFDQVTGHDSKSWQKRLIRSAERMGVNPQNSLAVNSLKSNGQIMQGNSRLWHQLEWLRARMQVLDNAAPETTKGVFEAIFENYLAPARLGTWVDELDANGNKTSDNCPASMLYHFVSCLYCLVESNLE